MQVVITDCSPRPGRGHLCHPVVSTLSFRCPPKCRVCLAPPEAPRGFQGHLGVPGKGGVSCKDRGAQPPAQETPPDTSPEWVGSSLQATLRADRVHGYSGVPTVGVPELPSTDGPLAASREVYGELLIPSGGRGGPEGTRSPCPPEEQRWGRPSAGSPQPGQGLHLRLLAWAGRPVATVARKSVIPNHKEAARPSDSTIL